MNLLKSWREANQIQDEFRHLEKALELPINSIQYQYEKELVLRGIPILEAKSIHSRLMEIAIETPFPTETVLAVHRSVKDCDLVKKIMDWASQRHINPLDIADLIEIDPTEMK